MRDIEYYRDFISDEFLSYLKGQAQPVNQVPQLTEIGKSGGLESKEALKFLCELYEELQSELNLVLKQRKIDRHFIDTRTKLAYHLNQDLKIDYLDPNYETVIGQRDSRERLVVGPLNDNYCKRGQAAPIANLPDFLKGHHITLFGPPDDPKLSINAMNAFHRKIKGEPKIVEELLANYSGSPKWGADDEDSKTPLREDLISAGENLTQCFSRQISFQDPQTKKQYRLEKNNLSLPIKRFPGLALPCAFLLYKDQPLPLHLYDFSLHLFHNWHNQEALAFYVPKLETTEEARYIKTMVARAELKIQQMHPEYRLGTIRLFVVLENPRLIFRVHELMDELFPYFAGASLGWHDYLASTARLFKEDANYRIPVKADPNIVINYIKASHQLLAEVVGARGGVKIGGMYGVLPVDNDLKGASFQLTIRGYIKDVITQMKRELSGFWVAHPDFVRLGIALVEAWKLRKEGDSVPLTTLVKSLLDKKYHQEIIEFIERPDLEGLDPDSPMYARSLIVADLKESKFIANDHPEEIRYNIFQSLQYLTDWLSGNGCVALPAQIETVPVRVMDDLATAERSRWEVWHEIHHQRFSIEDFLRIAAEEFVFIRKDLSNKQKIVQVKWDRRTEKWYPVALNIMIQLMTNPNPVEFASELLLPFSNPTIRESERPWDEMLRIDASKYKLATYIDKFNFYFSICGNQEFAQAMASQLNLDLKRAQEIILNFNVNEITAAAFFHGDIGEDKKTLDEKAQNEQSMVHQGEKDSLSQLRILGAKYLEKFGIKFLISAQGRNASELLQVLNLRLQNSIEKELINAKQALWEISAKRLLSVKHSLHDALEASLTKYNIVGAQICISSGFNKNEVLLLGEGKKALQDLTKKTLFQLASLSKSIASCFAIEYFENHQISLETSVNSLFEKTTSQFRLVSLNPAHPEWSNEVTICHLMEHTALNLHYVNGIPYDKEMPKISSLLNGNEMYSYAKVGVLNPPGQRFQYSGGGFLVLEHLIEALENNNIKDVTRSFFSSLGDLEITFDQKANAKACANGYLADGSEVPTSRKMFPAFAAGALGTAEAVTQFLEKLAQAFHDCKGAGPISHSTAVQMLFGQDKASIEFMGARMGLGIFTIEAGPNRFALHQGANDGFRCIFVYCFAGPDLGKGFTILCNADSNGVSFICEAAQRICRELNLEGVDTTSFPKQFNTKNVSPENIVNQAYKTMLFDAFRPTLPEEIVRTSLVDPLLNLSLAKGSEILEVSNQKFARAENLFSAHPPEYDPELYGMQGKIMDSWESVRHNAKASDDLIFKILKPACIRYLLISTQFHLGNQAPAIQFAAWDEESQNWKILLDRTELKGHAIQYITLEKATEKYNTFKVSQLPDGGLTRFAIFETLPNSELNKFSQVAISHPFHEAVPQPKKPLAPKYFIDSKRIQSNYARLENGEEFNVASLAYGAKIISASNEHYGPAIQILSPYTPLDMFDGFESARSRTANHFEEIVIGLKQDCKIHHIEIDFTYFKNNNPLKMQIQAFVKEQWLDLISRTNVKAYAGNTFTMPIGLNDKVQQLKIKVYPDGGFNRIRVFSRFSGLNS